MMQVFEHAALDWIAELGERTGAFALAESTADPSRTFDWIATLIRRSDGTPIRLFVEVKSRLTPQLALGYFERIAANPPNGVLLLCSPSISPRVAELCREYEVSYLDASGNCRIAAPGLFIQIEGRENLHPDTRHAADPFALKSSRVVRLLLTDPHRRWQVQELASEAQISLGLASRIKQTLLEQAYLQVEAGKLGVREPRALLGAWSRAYSASALSERLAFYAMHDCRDIEQRIAHWCEATGTRYGLTGLSGAWRVAPMVRYNTAMFAIDTTPRSDKLNRLIKDVQAKPVDSGENLVIWLPRDPFVFYGSRTMGQSRIVSPLQLYLDLNALSGRGAEAAAEILETEILPTW